MNDDNDSNKRKYISIDMLEKMYVAVGKTNSAFRNMVILSLLYDTGIITTELIKCKVSDLDLTSNTLVLNSNKNKVKRVIPFSILCRQYIDVYLDIYGITEKPNSFLFFKDLHINEHTSITDRSIQHLINRIFTKAGYPDCMTRDLQYSFAINQVRSGTTLIKLSEYLDVSYKHASKYCYLVESKSY